MRLLTILSSVRESSSFKAYRKLHVVGLVQVSRLLDPLCHPSARLEDQGSKKIVASHWFYLSLSKRRYRREDHWVKRRRCRMKWRW